MEWATLGIALLGAVTGVVALTWQVRNDMRRMEVTFCGNTILLTNHTRRPVSIDSVGFIRRDGTPMAIVEEEFVPLCVVPAEGQEAVWVGILATNFVAAKYVFALDMRGKEYRHRISRSDVEMWRLTQL